MRQGQNNRRMRGRGNGGGNNNQNRRGPNPLTRSYESNGPDVKVRGTAQHIAEKYLSLARDAHSSGDRVMAENYLQHAEHYNRIIAAALAQQQAIREQREEAYEDDFADEMDNRFAPTQIGQQQREHQSDGGDQPYDGEQPQPLIEAKAAEGENEDQPRETRPDNGNGQRNPANGEEGRDRNAFRNRRRERGPRPPREPRGEAVAADGDQPDAGGLLATLSRGADKPVVVAEE